MTGPRLVSGRALAAFAAPGAAEGSRVAVAASRRLGGAVRRNRARRRLRSAAVQKLLSSDSILARSGIVIDVLLIARAGALTEGYPTLLSEVELVGRRAIERLGSVPSR